MRILIGITFSLLIIQLTELSSEIENEGLSTALKLTLFLILTFVIGNGLTNLY